MKRFAIAMVLAAGMGCEKPAEQPEPAPSAATTAPAPEAEEALEAPEAPADSDPAAAADFSSFKDGDWCPRAYTDTVKIVSAMKATIKQSGVKMDDESAYEPPEEGRFVSLCNQLPLGMRKCMVIGYAAQQRETCQSELDGLDEGGKATYGQLMGK